MARGEISYEISDREHVFNFDDFFYEHTKRWARVVDLRFGYMVEQLEIDWLAIENLRDVYPDQLVVTSFNPDRSKFKAATIPHMEFNNRFMVCMLLLKQRKRLSSQYKLQLLEQLDEFMEGNSEYEQPFSARQADSLIPYHGLNFNDVFKKAPNFWDPDLDYFRTKGKVVSMNLDRKA